MRALDLESVKNEELFKLFQDFYSENIIFFYHGPVWQQVLEEATLLIKKNVERFPQVVIQQKFIVLFIEIAQNIIRYSSAKPGDKSLPGSSQGMMLAGATDKTQCIVGCNTVGDENEAYLRETLPSLKSMTKNDLNKYYKAALRTNTIEPENGSVGLGLIDIFRRAENVDFEFHSRPQGDTLYLLRVEI